MTPMTDKVVLITGAGRGQGQAMAELFAARGASVAICDILETEGVAVARQICDNGGTASFFPLNVASAADWDRTVRAVVEWKGRLDVLVNNAGIVKRRTIATYSEDEWRQVLDVNLTGAFLGIRSAVAPMIAQGGGAIVNIGSNSAFSGHADVAYSASKWGMRGLTRSAAMEFAKDRIRVNCVCPGLVVTDINRDAPHLTHLLNLTPLRRAVKPEETAAAVYFLASDEAGMITGEELVVDGGFTAGGNYWSVSTAAGFYG
ncbi:SDR family NAD(P)-dependent oxidoreductase [Azospirillum endophyticum]